MSFLSKVTVEPVCFLFILTIYVEYTAVQDVIYIKTCHGLYSNYSSSDQISTLCLKSSSSPSAPSNETIAPSNGTIPELVLEVRPNITIDRNEVSRLTAIEMKYYMATFSICAVIASLWAGSWSDCYGRKPVLILPSLLGVLAEIAFMVCSFDLNGQDGTYFLIYIAAIFNGISGGSTTVISSCFGYVSDVTLTSERSTRITFLESALFIGGFIGYNLAGLLIKFGLDYYLIFLVCAILHALLVIYVFLFIPETRGPKSRASQEPPKSQEETSVLIHDNKSWLSFDHVRKMFRVVTIKRPSRSVIHLLCLCSATSSLTLSVQLTLTYVFVKRSPLNWDTYLYSVYNSVNFLVSGVALIIILPLIYHKFGPKDALLASIGFISKAIGLINFGFSLSTGQTFATIIFLSLSEFTMPAIRSLISKLVTTDERAKAFSLLGSIQNLVQFAGSLIFPTIFTMTALWFPGLVFLIAAVFQSFAAIVLLVVHLKLDLNSMTSKIDADRR